jgi:hypothetical protein
MNQGTNQKDRLQQARALWTDFFRLDGRTVAGLYEETRQAARSLRFFENSGSGQSTDWSAFFGEPDPKILDESYDGGTVQPHLALFVTFLRLFKHAQNDMNGLVSAHLDFFYRNVLGQKRLPVEPDHLYLFFELAKGVDRFMLEENATIAAGKDGAGRQILFANPRQLPLSQVKISQVMSVFNPKNSTGHIRSALSSDISKIPGGWHPFGVDSGQVDVSTGWAISSPLLLLTQGARKITVTFSLPATGDGASTTQEFPAFQQFQVQLTGKEGWFNAGISEESNRSNGQITFILILAEKAPAITPFDPLMHAYEGFTDRLPLMRFILKAATCRDYELLHATRFTGIDLHVEASNISALSLSNDYGMLDASKASQPFGFNPVQGAHIVLGLAELSVKPVRKIDIAFKWRGIPTDFATHYEGYLGDTDSLVRSGADFKVEAAVRVNGEWQPATESDGNKQIELFGKVISIDMSPFIENRQNSPAAETDGFLRLTLVSPPQAFGHALYPRLLAKASLKQARGQDVDLPNEPYTPAIEGVRMSYRASATLDLNYTNEQPINFYHIEPFGISAAQPVNQIGVPSLVMVSDALQDSGQFFLGLEGIIPPLHLPLFFEIRETSEQKRMQVDIAYLTAVGWQKFAKDQILEDGTFGLQETGVITLRLPVEMTRQNPVMALQSYWLRFSVKEMAAGFDPITAIRTNAALFKRVIGAETNAFSINALPKGSVKTFTPPRREIKKIEQPYVSFGGRSQETDPEYFVRISELLRHKGRAITGWDYEHLILARFPQIYKVKCIGQRSTGSLLMQPGSVHIIVIPQILPTADRQKLLRPVAGKSLLDSISAYIETVKSDHVRAHVTNASFVEVRVIGRIGFQHESAQGLYSNRLQEELRTFLSPWAFNSDVEIQLGSKLHMSSLTGFIESRPYVDFIEKIRWEINHVPTDDQEIELDEKSVIVSAERHELVTVTAETVPYQNYRGVGQMIVDINFEVL